MAMFENDYIMRMIWSISAVLMRAKELLTKRGGKEDTTILDSVYRDASGLSGELIHMLTDEEVANLLHDDPAKLLAAAHLMLEEARWYQNQGEEQKAAEHGRRAWKLMQYFQQIAPEDAKGQRFCDPTPFEQWNPEKN